MPPPQLLELRPNPDHLNPNFDGYKLSLDKIPVLTEGLNTAVDRVLPSNDQYSFLHAKLFGLHNHLTGETFGDNGSVYFVDQSQYVQKAFVDQFSNTVSLVKVWEVPFKERKPGSFNFSLKFASETLAVLSDGAGMLYILDTDLRSNDGTWQCVFCDEVLGIEKQFVIQDVVCVESKLHCLLFSVEQESVSKKHSAILHWMTLLQAEDKSWGAVALRELKCSKGDVYYAYFEPGCNAIYCVSDGGFKFTIDSENPVENKPEPEGGLKKYEWAQTDDDVSLKFKLPEDFEKDDIRVNVQAYEIDVSFQNDLVLKGKLTHKVNADVTTWTTTNNVLEILLTKEEAAVVWSNVVEGDENGQCCPDPRTVEEAHQRLQHLCSDTEAQHEHGPLFSQPQIEECDFEDDKQVVLERLCCTSHDVTHRSNLGSNQVLLITKLSEDLPPAIAVRYDVDGCLWQPLGNENNFSLKHEATLLAFGYVQASKQQRKFSGCAPDLGYAVICESTRHIFIYRQKKSIGNAELRNRTTGRRFATVAQQQVVSISNDEILGMHAANSILFLLTENSIFALQL